MAMEVQAALRGLLPDEAARRGGEGGEAMLLAEAKVFAATCSFICAGAGCWAARRLEQQRVFPMDGAGSADGCGGGGGPGGIRRATLTEAVLMFCNCMAAGILLAASQVHMLPDASEALKSLSDFPVASAIAGGAFVFLVVLGEAVGSCMPERDEPHIETDCVAYRASFAILPHRGLSAPHGCDQALHSGPPTPGRSTGSPWDEDVHDSGHGQGGHGSCTADHGHSHQHSRNGGGGGVEAAAAASMLAAAAGAVEAGQAHLVPFSAHGDAPLRSAAEGGTGQGVHQCHSHSACCRVHRHSDMPCTMAVHPTRSPRESPGRRAGSSTSSAGLARPLLNSVEGEGDDRRGALWRWAASAQVALLGDGEGRGGGGACGSACVGAGAAEANGSRSHAPTKVQVLAPPPGVDAAAFAKQLAAKHDHAAAALCHVRAVGVGPMAEVKSFLLFFALCFHSVMEGLGIGSAHDSGLLFGVVVAVLAHKGLAAFALGCSLTQSDLPPWKFWTFVFIFSAGTPLGCAFGALAELGGAASQTITSGVCTALASGTFLQVAAMELLPRALAEEHSKAVGAIGLSLGYAAMSVLAIWC